ncbi:hypothetical protein [Mucilaginibacter sp. L196]|uniref:hypothetical protein n=1 Tax=Mucilaginibacter sp. L196 TaxID=1641870 RepID=UPI00131CAC48|nr:hypothetical protein [Mucilaginibacter sp. L196]
MNTQIISIPKFHVKQVVLAALSIFLLLLLRSPSYAQDTTSSAGVQFTSAPTTPVAAVKKAKRQ